MNLSAVATHIKDVVYDVCTSLYDKGIANILNDLSTTGEGLQKTTNVAAWALSLSTSVTAALPKYILENARNTVFALTSVKYFRELTDGTTTRYNISSRLLLGIAGVCETFHLAVTYELVKVGHFSHLSSQIGSFSIFKHSPFDNVLNRPSLFFLFIGSLASSIENIVSHYQNGSHLFEYFKARDMLLHIGNGAKMVLIYFHQMPFSSGLFQIANGVSQIADLTLFSMKNQEPRITYHGHVARRQDGVTHRYNPANPENKKA